ncbi:hypothetical protein CSPX01_00945 [Colletotrichum filicis]|nr:hypothetical protein CSPX01_00945 [Colletotrichum filicis]
MAVDSKAIGSGVIKLLLRLTLAVYVEVYGVGPAPVRVSTLHSADICPGRTNTSPAATLPLLPNIQQPKYNLPSQAIETIETASTVTLGCLRVSPQIPIILDPWLSSLNQS